VTLLTDRTRHIFDGMASACVPWNFHKMAASQPGGMMVGTKQGSHLTSRANMQLATKNGD
jgi:hypothetical protein